MDKGFSINRTNVALLLATALFGGFLFVVPHAHAAQFATDTDDTLNTGLISYYQLQDATDYYGTNNFSAAGTVNYGSGLISSSSGADFGSSNSGNRLYYSSVPNSTTSSIVLMRLPAYSLNLWAKADAQAPSYTNNMIFTWADSTTANHMGSITLQYGNWAGQYQLFINRADTSANDQYGDPFTMTTGQWYMFTLTYDGENIALYINGSSTPFLIGSSTQSGTNSVFDSNPTVFELGAYQGGSRYFPGAVDGFGFWTKKLSSQEMTDLYNGGAGDPMEGRQYYAQIENGSARDMHVSTSTTSAVLETLPAGWAIDVTTTTDASGNPIVDGSSNTWFGITDPTDGVTGWMVASDTTTQYISSYDGSAQAALEASSSDQIATGTASGDTGDYVLSAIDNYYNESTTVNSLYSNNDDTGVNANTATPPGSNLQSDISILDQRGYPEKVVLAIAALEDGGTGFNNQIVTRDYGHGIMQVTPSILYYEQHDGNDYSSTNDPRGIASGVTIPPCASYMTSTYTNCYADSGSGDGSDAHSYISDTSVSGSPTFLQYTNTPQSIYANVKDGMQILASKYGTTEGYSTRVCDNYPDPVVISSTVDYATTTYSCTDEEIIDLTAAYNGSSSPYLSEVATALTDIGDYFPSVTSTDASTTDIINKLNVANYNSVYFALHSPGDLSVQDTHGHTIGVVNGVVTDTFPFATYDPTTKSGYIFFPQDNNLTYKVTGTGTGVYGLDIDITSGTQRIAFHRDENVPITPGEVHTYTINATMIAQGKNGVTFKIDKKGNGTINETDQLGATMTSVVEPKSLPLPSIPFIPIKLPLPVKKKIPTPIFVNPINSTFTLPISTETFNSSTFHWNIASSTISTSSIK